MYESLVVIAKENSILLALPSINLFDKEFLGKKEASLTAKSSGVNQRRQRQRLELTQRLLDPLPEQLAPPYRQEVLFWRGLRWATAGLLLAWILKR